MIQQPWLFSPLKNYSVGIQGLQIRLATHVQNWAGRYEPLLNRQGLNVYNFYSSGDEVFDESPEAPGVLTGVFHWPTTDFDWPYFHLNLKLDAFAWQKREVLKGVNAVGSLSAGWGFYCGDIDTHNESRWGKYTAAEANEMVNNGSIVTNTVCERSMPAMFHPIISDFDKADILAPDIPAVSSPAGKVKISATPQGRMAVNCKVPGSLYFLAFTPQTGGEPSLLFLNISFSLRKPFFHPSGVPVRGDPVCFTLFTHFSLFGFGMTSGVIFGILLNYGRAVC